MQKLKKLFGINLKEVKCPECGATQPKRRKPKNMRQAMWGGSACPNCGTVMDKWGKHVE